MPTYNLFGLDTRTFQQLCQALAIAELGPGVIVFGDGRDGARDAAFRGKVNYPTPAEQWEGSLIIQAKYRQLRFDDTKKAGAWVVNQLKADLSKFVGAPHRPDTPSPTINPPEYYIAVTNIALTAVPDVGSDAAVRQLLEEYSGHLRLKGYDIWDGNKIERLLDNHRDIAASYAAFITAGDVLARMHEYLHDLQPDFSSVMADYLQSEFSGPDRLARLNEAGSTVQRKSLADVFIDLPVADSTNARITDESPDGSDRLPGGFLSELLKIAGLRFDRRSVLDRQESRKLTNSGEIPLKGRIVLIGGPGQGKSTLGQFICQIYRAALLRELSPAQLSGEVSFGLSQLDEWCAQDEIELPQAKRFPIRVDLKSFADSLAGRACVSLLEYIAQQIDKRSGRPISRTQIDLWLARYPWLVVLDGLDEVPAAGNRTEVLDEIQQFESQCATRGADVLLVATSRPQGYSDAFNPRHYWHRYLTPLSIVRAMRYAERLLSACHFDDPDKQSEILTRLHKASSHPNTRRLLLSPLQVTILAVLAELQGELPDDRWELFQEYYQTIYKRETQRNQPLSPILRDYKVEIDRVHQYIGLKLQVRNEASGRNDALLSRTDLGLLLRECLSERFAEGTSELDQVADQIETAALDRLVFLVSPKQEEIGFEIRSLQEFMAARAITDGSDKEICLRMKSISAFPFWRNVFLFAAGRCVRDRRHLVEFIIGICTVLNNDADDKACTHTMAGSCLALDLLEDATFHRTRKHSLSLLEKAMLLLATPSDTLLERLALVCQRSSESTVLREYLKAFIGSHRVKDQAGGWRVLLLLVESGESWASELADELWPVHRGDQFTTINVLPSWDQTQSCWISKKRIELAEYFDPFELCDNVAEESKPDWLCAFERIVIGKRFGEIPIHINHGDEPSFLMRIPILHEFDDSWREVKRTLPDLGGTWAEVVAALTFVEAPSRATLSKALLQLDQRVSDHRGMPSISPWPLAHCIKLGMGASGLRSTAQQASEGRFGDYEDWMAIQDSWISNGVYLSDSSVREPIGSHWINLAGPIHLVEGVGIERLQRVIHLYERTQPGEHRTALAKVIGTLVAMGNPLRIFREASIEELPTPDSFAAWFLISKSRVMPRSLARLIPWQFPLSDEWLDALDVVGKKCIPPGIWAYARRQAPEEVYSALLSELIAGFIAVPTRHGLLRWICGLIGPQDRDIRIPKSLLFEIESKKPAFIPEMIYLLLSGGQLSIDNANRISAAVIQLAANAQDRHLLPSFRLANRYWDQPWAMHLVESIFEKLPPENVVLREGCHAWFENHLSRRICPLREERVKSELGLSKWA